jgi:hypothetical protein
MKKEKSIESVMGVSLGIPNNNTYIMVFSAENVIAAYENEAKEVLRRNGYPVTLEELWKRKEELLPDLENGKGLSQVYDIFWMLVNLESVKTCVEKGDADQAVCYTASALYWATIARLDPVLPTVKMGKIFRLSQGNKRKKRKIWKGLSPDERAERNKKIKEHFQKSKLTPNSFAKKHSKKYKLSIRQISNILNS